MNKKLFIVERFLFGLLIMFLFIGNCYSTPIVAEPVMPITEGKSDLKIKFSYFEANGFYNDSTNFSEFQVGESRNGYEVMVGLKYGSGKDSEMELKVPYIYKNHIKPGDNKLSCSGFGDVYLIGKNKVIDNKISQSFMAISLGAKFPTGKSIYNVNKNVLPTGSGTWDIIGGIYLQEKRENFIIYGDISYIYRFGLVSSGFAGYGISEINSAETEVKITPGGSLNLNLAAEYPLFKLISVITELNWVFNYESRVEYVKSGVDALSDLTLKSPELQKSNTFKSTSGVKIYLGNNISFGVGVGVPMSMVNSYGGLTYFVNAEAIF
ncbi:MAG: hypothetical protein ABH873_09755 [Candidatus Firestonebacteria bacterium]